MAETVSLSDKEPCSKAVSFFISSHLLRPLEYCLYFISIDQRKFDPQVEVLQPDDYKSN